MKTLRSLSIAVLVALAAITSRGGDGYLLYDLTTKQVSAPLVFWRSNLVAGAEISWTYTGNLPVPVLADSITRDTELAAAIAALSGTYQPLNTHLSDLADGSLTGSKVGSGIAAGNITSGTLDTNRLPASITGKLDPTGSGTGLSGVVLKGGDTMTGTLTLASTASALASNKVAATTEYVDKAVANGGGGGGAGNANTNNSTAWANATSVSLYDVVVRGTLSAANLSVGSISGFTGRWTIPQGGTDATNAAQARINFGLEPDVDVQVFRLPLLQLYVALAASGDMGYRTASGIITNTPSTSFGRSVLNIADASAGRTLLGVVAAAGGAFSGDITVPTEAYGAGWSGSAEVPTKGDIYTWGQSILSGGFISSVETNDLQVNTGRLSIASSLGTGRLVRESQLSSNGISTAVDIQIFTNTGSSTWTKPANAKIVEILAFGGGAGGGSGRRGTNAHAGGGGGGGGAGMFWWTFSAAELGNTETVIVGTNGIGGAAVTSDNTDGNAGSNGGASSVGSLVVASGGSGGGAGQGTGTGPGSSQTSAQYRGSAGTAGAHASSASAPTTVQDRPGGAAGGGGGGGITTAGVTNTPANGGAIFVTTYIAGGSAGTVNGVNGTNGTASNLSYIPRPGSGGGGGYPGFSSIGNGGNGGWPGGGGGGGAGSRNGTTSGAGGPGASGVVVIKTYF